MERLDQALRVDSGLVGSDWQDWLRVYIAGGSASEWAGGRPNDAAQDLDVLIGVDYARARGYGFEGMDDRQIDTALNAALRHAFNRQEWDAPFGGRWDVTAYANHDAYDIRKIKPYAAYDVTGMTWAVKPPHLPEHSVADFHPALVQEARAMATEARAILRLPEPGRTREAQALWERIHAGRRRAFSGEGEGWSDPGNVLEKWLAYAPGNLLGKIRDLALTKTAAGKLPGQVVMMHPRDLMQYVETYRTGDEGGRRHRQDLAESFRQHGYDPERHGGMSGDKHYFPISSPIELVHQDHGSYFMEGNHRTHALNDIGYDKPVPVLVRDLRTQKTAAKRKGVFPGDKLPWHQAEWVRIDKLLPHREFIHSPGESWSPDYSKRWAPKHSPEAWAENEQSVREEGMREPAILEYNPDTRRAYLGEGNHRLEWARRAGWPAIPVFGAKPFGNRDKPGQEVPGEPKLRREPGHGYFPSTFSPSDVLPGEYMWHPEEHHMAALEPAANDDSSMIVRGPHDLSWGPEEWARARREPWHAAAQLAQRQVRLDHPKLTMPFPRSHEGGDEMVEHMLARAGYPASEAKGAFVARHPDPKGMTSNIAWLNGKPGVALHPDRWDYGTVAHEAGHHVFMQRHALAPNEDQTDEMVHGPEWAGYYAKGLNALSKGAGDDFLRHHQRYHGMIQQHLQIMRPSDLDEAEQHLPPSRWRQASGSNGDRFPSISMDKLLQLKHIDAGIYGGHTVADVLPFKKRDMEGDPYYGALREHMREHGQTAPIQIRPGIAPGSAEVGNGAHRIAIAHDLGWDSMQYSGKESDTKDRAWDRAWHKSQGHRGRDPEKCVDCVRRQMLRNKSAREAAVHEASGGGRTAPGGGGSWYHGSQNAFEPGAYVSPRQGSGDDRPYVYLTTRKEFAAGVGGPRVHEVQPLGPVEPDPHATEHAHGTFYRSKVPLKVIRLVPGEELDLPRPGVPYDFEHGRTASGSNGDRFVACSKGHEHWGAYGAAGLLIRHKGDDGLWRYLLQKRSDEVDNGGKWSIPAGAIGKSEDEKQGALREAREELGPLPRGLAHHHTVKSTDCGDWAFHTVVMDSPEHFLPRGGGETEFETAGTAWHTAAEVAKLKASGELHPAFAKSWDQVRRSRGPKEASKPDHPTKTKQEVNYRPGTGRKQCGNCTMIRLLPPDFESAHCILVKGLIEEDHVCDEWEAPATKGASLLEVRPEDPTNVGAKTAVKGYDPSPRSGMIYLDVPPHLIRQVRGGVDDFHITLVYLGADVDDEAFGRACRRAAEAASRSQPLEGVLHGTETFPASDSGGQKVPAFVPAYVPGIGALRRELEDLSASEHKHYRPHVTLAYLEEGDPLPPPHPARKVRFDHLCVKRGDDVVRFPLGHS